MNCKSDSEEQNVKIINLIIEYGKLFSTTSYEKLNLCENAPDYNLNDCEKELLKKYGDSVKFGLFASKEIAEKWTVFKFGINGVRDCSDAFRHAMFNANNAYYLGPNVAKEFGDAHECANSPTKYLEGEMDLHNNAQGISAYISLPKNINGFVPANILAEEICNRLANGDMKVFSDFSNDQSPLVSSSNCKCN